MTYPWSFLRPRLHPRPHPYADAHVYAHCSHPSPPFIVIIHIVTLHWWPVSSHFYALVYTYSHADTPTSTPIAHTHPFISHIFHYFALMTCLQSFYALSYIYTHVHTPMRPRSHPRPLLATIPSFHSCHIYCYFVLKTCPKSFLGPSLNLHPGPYAHIYAHCSHPQPFIYLFQLSYFYFPLITCLQLFFRPRLHLCPRAYGHASTPTSTPIAQ